MYNIRFKKNLYVQKNLNKQQSTITLVSTKYTHFGKQQSTITSKHAPLQALHAATKTNYKTKTQSIKSQPSKKEKIHSKEENQKPENESTRTALGGTACTIVTTTTTH
jgi:hypothetical protein